MLRLCLIFASGLFLCGCSGPAKTSTEFPPGKGSTATRPSKAGTNAPTVIVTPGGTMPGKVVMTNPNARFVVLSFPLGSVPAPGRQLNVYREGLKVGEIKISGPQRDQNTIADIVTGECKAGDEVRED